MWNVEMHSIFHSTIHSFFCHWKFAKPLSAANDSHVEFKRVVHACEVLSTRVAKRESQCKAHCWRMVVENPFSFWLLRIDSFFVLEAGNPFSFSGNSIHFWSRGNSTQLFRLGTRESRSFVGWRFSHILIFNPGDGIETSKRKTPIDFK